MRRTTLLTLATLLAIFGTVPAMPLQAADDPAATARFEKLGGQATRGTAGLTGLMLKDSSQLGADDFKALGDCGELRKLTLYGKCHGLNDETLPLLRGLQKLEELSTDGVRLSDAGLAPLADLKGLRSLAFFHISWGAKDFDGSGLAGLRDLPELRRLTVAGTPFNDAGLAAVAKLDQLEEFRTWHTFQTAAGNAHLKDCKNLKGLLLGQRLKNGALKAPHPPSLTDAVLPVLAEIAGLERLSLDEARLSYAGLISLKKLPKLKRLELKRIDIPADDIARLRTELPDVTIDHAPLTDAERTALDKLLRE